MNRPGENSSSRARCGLQWDSQPAVLELCRELAFGNCHLKDAAYEDIRTFNPEAFDAIARASVRQQTVRGIETRSVGSLFAASMVGAIRDFAESEGAVDSALNGAPVAAWLGAKHSPLRKAMRRQLRRSLDSPVWIMRGDSVDSPHAGFVGGPERVLWPCPYCGEEVAADEGYGRRRHLARHPDALPTRDDVGCAISRGFTRKLMLLSLATLVRLESWPRHRKYFVGSDAVGAIDAHFAQTADPVPFEQCAELTSWSIREFPHYSDWSLS